MKIIDSKILIADEGMRLTDGEVYAKALQLPECRSTEEFTEITEAEYIEIKKAREEAEIPTMLPE